MALTAQRILDYAVRVALRQDADSYVYRYSQKVNTSCADNDQYVYLEHRQCERLLSVTRTEVSDADLRQGIALRSLDQVSTRTKPSARSDDARAPIIPVLPCEPEY